MPVVNSTTSDRNVPKVFGNEIVAARDRFLLYFDGRPCLRCPSCALALYLKGSLWRLRFQRHSKRRQRGDTQRGKDE